MTKTSHKLVAAVAVAATLFTAACSSDDPTPTGGDPIPATGDPGGEEATTDGDGLYFYPPVEGAELTITSDVDSNESMVTVVGVDDSGDGQTVRINQVFTGTEGLEVEAEYTTGSDGSLILEIDAFLLGTVEMPETGEITTEASGDDMVIPAIEDLEAGETTSGAATITMGNGGFELDIETSFTVSGAGYESVTTALGSFEAYVVDVALTMESDLIGASEGSVRYWFVPGFGWVRQETAIDGLTMVHEVSASTVTP